jgi:NAD-dependent DNA ligase
MQGWASPNSPTQQIHYNVVNELAKVQHNHPMLSLDKTKSLDELSEFCGNRSAFLSLKLDGLTCSLYYANGKLQRAETRGNGVIGEDITHNAFVIPSIPKRIPYKEELVVDGEIICLAYNFASFAEEYANSRNFAAGSIRLLDSKECAKRNLTFVAWEMVKGYDDVKSATERLKKLSNNYFHIVPHQFVLKKDLTQNLIDTMKNMADIKREIVGLQQELASLGKLRFGMKNSLNAELMKLGEKSTQLGIKIADIDEKIRVVENVVLPIRNRVEEYSTNLRRIVEKYSI